MSILSRIRGGAKKATVRAIKLVRGTYDAARTHDENRKHWANADALSAGAAALPEIRRLLRMRARYEVANNSYARGIVSTLANDTVGTGPRLQMLTGAPGINAKVEAEFFRWSKAVGLAEILRTVRMAKVQDGEVFIFKTNNPVLKSGVKMDLKLVEGDQVANPWGMATQLSMSDGIEFDAAGNPTGYWLLRNHPGDLYTMGATQSDLIPAKNVIHYFRIDRPGQIRGVTELAPALGLFAQLRRYTGAVLGAAEAAADAAMVIYTDAPANGETDAMEPMDTIELEKRMATVMPGGWKLSGFKAEQPTTTYKEFKSEILNEIARCLNMPFNVAAGNSSGYNYSSGRLDHQTYFKAIKVEQNFMERVVLDPIFDAFIQEAILVEGLMPQFLRQGNPNLEHQWFWDGQEHVDPMKEAEAQATRLANHTATLAEEYAKRGKDWETELAQAGREATRLKELGLTMPYDVPQVLPTKPDTGDVPTSEVDDDA